VVNPSLFLAVKSDIWWRHFLATRPDTPNILFLVRRSAILLPRSISKREEIKYRAPADLLQVPLRNEILERKNERLADIRSPFDCVNGRVAVPLLGFSGLGASVGHYVDSRVLAVLCRFVDDFATAPHPLSI
jgi:hypothetical protein